MLLRADSPSAIIQGKPSSVGLVFSLYANLHAIKAAVDPLQVVSTSALLRGRLSIRILLSGVRRPPLNQLSKTSPPV